MYETWYPPAARPLILLAIFGSGLMLFHILFIVYWKLEKRGWKYVDYVWLGVAVVSLVGASLEKRRLISEKAIASVAEHRTREYHYFRDRVEFFTRPAVCLPFTRSEFSPANLEELQREYDKVCEFGKRIVAALPTDAPPSLHTTPFRDRPPVADPLLNRFYAELDEAVQRYLAAERRLNDAVAASKRGAPEWALLTGWPLLLAVALSLRITKVTGEIRLEA